MLAKQKMQTIAALLGEVHELNKALASVEFTETDEPMIDDETELGGRKRVRTT